MLIIYLRDLASPNTNFKSSVIFNLFDLIYFLCNFNTWSFHIEFLIERNKLVLSLRSLYGRGIGRNDILASLLLFFFLIRTSNSIIIGDSSLSLSTIFSFHIMVNRSISLILLHLCRLNLINHCL